MIIGRREIFVKDKGDLQDGKENYCFERKSAPEGEHVGIGRRIFKGSAGGGLRGHILPARQDGYPRLQRLLRRLSAGTGS